MRFQRVTANPRHRGAAWFPGVLALGLVLWAACSPETMQALGESLLRAIMPFALILFALKIMLRLPWPRSLTGKRLAVFLLAGPLVLVVLSRIVPALLVDLGNIFLHSVG